MADTKLEGYTLGQKHEYYNRLVQDAIKNNITVDLDNFNLRDSDVINLRNIDIASNNKNVEYILKVLTCDDMLYVSRAIKQSHWIINDQSYTHIINSEYLRTSLFPQMTTKAIIKFVKHIRNILNDQKRAEEFYSCEENLEEAAKWLPCCSLEFIHENITKHAQHIKTTLLKRLCEKSISVLEIYVKDQAKYKKRDALQATMFLLPSNTERFLDIVEANEFPKFNKRATTVLMKTSKNRVIDKFDKYYDFIHLPTFINCLKRENIKDFLLNQAPKFNVNNLYRRFNLDHLLVFIRLMPQEIRFEFVKEVFINKTHELTENLLSEKDRNAMTALCNITKKHLYINNNFVWYQFAPFNVALEKMIETKPLSKQYIILLEIVLTSTQNNVSHERTLLEYLRENKKNIEHNVMEEILTKLILRYNFVSYDVSTWKVLDDIFRSIHIYTKSKKSVHVLVEAVILYNITHKEKISEIVESKFNYNSLVQYHKKLSENEKEILFMYLYDLVVSKFTKCEMTTEEKFKEKVNVLEQVLNLLKDYKKELENYPLLISSIKDLIKLKTDKSWTVSMEALFNVRKTWRKLLFEESLAFCQTETVLLNALKHDPSLIEKNKSIVNNILCSNKTPLKQVLEKIKIYWPDSLGKNITITYMEKLNDLGDHKPSTRGLSILLPLKDLQELIEKYTPKESKIDWAQINEIELSVQQQFAKNMHISRPQPFPEIVLQFAKGDYLQHALPSLLSIFYNLNNLSSQKYIPKLLDAPVSLQKHGIRLAMSKLQIDQLLGSLSNIWKNTKNASIRSVMFKTIYELLCKEKDSNKIRTTWQLLETFIDNLTFQEHKAIYKLLFEVEKVPLEVRGPFYIKSYKFLHRLVNSDDEYKDDEYRFYTTFTPYSREIIEQLPPNFVADIISEFIANEFMKRKTEVWSRGCVINIISSYLLCTADEQTQLQRYEKVLLPILKQSFDLWDSEDYIKNNLATLLNTLRCDIKKYVIDMKKINPNKMFLLIQEELKCALKTPSNYMLLTKWNLTVTFIAILDGPNPILDWEKSCVNVGNEFGNKCKGYLEEDCNKYFPRIYLLFVKALNSMLNNFIPTIAYYNIYKNLIQDEAFIQGYLAAIILISDTNLVGDDQSKKVTKKYFKELCDNIYKHPSTEIKMHYYNKIKPQKRLSKY